MYIKVKNKWQLAFDILMIVLGTTVMGFAFSIFLEPNNISTGGFSGLSMIISTLLNKMGIHFLNSSIIYFVLNIGLFLYALGALGKRFAIKSLIGIASFSVAMELCSLINLNLNFEPLISATYGGVLMGVGIGLVVRFGGSTGGGDMIASIVRRKNPKASIGSIVIIIDMIVVVLSLFVFSNGIEILPYTIVALGICSVCTDFVNDGYKQVRAYHIITNKGDAISKRIMEELSRGCTRTKCEGMYSHEDRDYIICLISKFQSGTLTRILREEDPTAFIYSTKVSDVVGFWTKTAELNKEIDKFQSNKRNEIEIGIQNTTLDTQKPEQNTPEKKTKHNKKDTKWIWGAPQLHLVLFLTFNINFETSCNSWMKFNFDCI